MLSLLTNLPRQIVKAVVGIWRFRWLALGVAWVLAIAGWAMIASIPDLYESRAQVYINTNTALDETISEVGVRPNLEMGVRIIRRQLLSRDNMERVIYDVGLDANIENAADLQRLADNLSEAIQVEMAEQGYFTFRYADPDPKTAQRVVASLLDLFIEQNLLTASGDVNRAIQNLDRELAVRRRELDDIDADIAEFRRVNASELAGTRRQSRLLDNHVEELGRLEDRIALAEARIQRLRASLAETPRYAAGSNIDALKLELATLQTQFTDSYPDIQRLKAQIRELESGSEALPDNPVYTELQRALTAAQDEITSLETRRRRLATDVDQLTLDAAETPEAESQLEALMRERNRIEQTYTSLAEERTEMDIYANLNRGGGAIDYTRFEAPKVPAAPIWPPRGLLVLAVAVLAAGAGGALTMGLGLFDRTYTQTSDLEASLGLPVLGAISPSPTDELRVWRMTERTGFVAATCALFVVAAVISVWVGGSPEAAETTAMAQSIEVSALEGLRE